ncbi:DNA-processing protein DprA [Bullifex sp.]|uniref:DNA-processing protein DprA n=1 Tax=Bullifex sp. TaxID=2815808 RepID=UPI002A82F49F|nr:DNA-processing protein DprA [Bullifex sp.]MDD5973231.1 DNA-processing protein DprA [Spirochaetales bacterium]MDY4068159.1 DNA-processing protein DprA [Bullifex sp.]
MRKNENEALLYETLFSLAKKDEKKAFLMYNMVALKADITRTLPEIISQITDVTGFNSYEISETYYRLRNAFSAYHFDYTIISELDDIWPKSLKGSDIHFLYLVGKKELLTTNKVAIRGFRSPSEDGKNNAISAVREIEAADATLVTTLDVGLDHYCASYALSQGLPIILILSSPLHVAVPESGKELMVNVANTNGLLVSQFPPSAKVEKWYAVPRNRLLVSLCDHFLICEEKDGGPLFNQAESFLEQKGRVLAYETFVTNPIYTYAQKLSQQVGVTILKRKGDLKKAITPPKKKERKKKDDEQLELFDL